MTSAADLEKVNSYMEKWWDRLNTGVFSAEYYEAFERDSLRAKHLLDDILHKDPNNEEAIDALLRWHLCSARINNGFAGNKERLEKAISHMKEVVKIDPDNADYFALLGVCYKQAGNKELAIEQFEKVLQIDPNHPAREELTDIDKTDASSKSGCFIATACYGSYAAPEVMVLRSFRDRVLLNSLPGKVFVKIYYFISPPIADFISQRETLKTMVRRLLIGPLIYAFKDQDRRK